jgi:pyruvate dehydrogenase (quinone)
VFNNEDLNEVTWEQRVMEGNPRYAATQSIPNFPYARFADILGFKGIYVDTPDLLRPAWQQVLASDRPVVLEVKTDPDVVPLPPHVTLREARGFLSSIAKGDAGGGSVIAETASQVLNAFIGKKE